MTITLQAVTEHNVDTIIALPLLPEQQDYLASNAYSIAQAGFHPASFFTRAICLDDQPIGFLMYVSVETGLDDEGEMLAEIRLGGA